MESSSTRYIKQHRNICLLMIASPLMIFGLVLGTIYISNRVKVKAASPNPPSGQHWNMVFSDEFNDSTLDLNKWEPSWFAGNRISKPVNGNEQSCYDPSLLAEGGGTLTMTAVTRNCTDKDGRTYNYASGLINSRENFTFTYGYFEARMWLAPGTGSIHNWPQIWVNGTGTWPTTGEIDAMEGLGGRACYHFHYSGGGPGGCPNLSNQSGWHIFGADWEPGAIKYYYDDQFVGQVSSGVTSAPMYLVAALGVSSTISGPVVTPSTMKIDYIRVYQLAQGGGSPPSTPPPAPSPSPSPSPVPPPTPNPTPSSPTSPPEQTPTLLPVTVPNANPNESVEIPSGLPTQEDGSLVADFNGDGLNDVVKDNNNDGEIDPKKEILIDGTNDLSLTNTSKPSVTSGQKIGHSSDQNTSASNHGAVIIKAGPLPEVKIAKPVAYTFLVVQGIAVTGVTTYLVITKLSIFAGVRARWGL